MAKRNQGRLAIHAQTFLRAAIGADGPHGRDEPLQILARRAGAQGPSKIGPGRGVQAEQPDAVGRQAAPIAGRAERLGRRRDDAERGAVRQEEPIGRRRRAVERQDRPYCASIRASISRRETTASGVQRVAPPTSMYSMNRTSAPTPLAYSISGTISSSLTPRITTVSSLSDVEARGGGRVDTRAAPRASSSIRVSARKRSRSSVSRLTVMRWSPAAAQRRRLGAQQDAVGGQRQIGDRAPRREAFDEDRQIAPQQRLAAGNPHAVDAKRRKDVHERRRFPRTSAGSRAAATRSPAPACSNDTGGCSGP